MQNCAKKGSGSIIKNSLSRLIDKCKQVKKSIINYISSLSPKNKPSHSQMAGLVEKKTHPVSANAEDEVHVRAICAEFLMQIKTDYPDKKAFNEWEVQEIITYYGSVTNKTIDNFIEQPGGERVYKATKEKYQGTLDKQKPNEVWSKKIFDQVMLKIKQNRANPLNKTISDTLPKYENSAHLLANPTIYKAVFNYYLHIDAGTFGTERVNDNKFIWQRCHMVFAKIFPTFLPPEEAIKDSKDYLQALEKSLYPVPATPCLMAADQTSLAKPRKHFSPVAVYSGKKEIKQAHERFMESMIFISVDTASATSTPIAPPRRKRLS